MSTSAPGVNGSPISHGECRVKENTEAWSSYCEMAKNDKLLCGRYFQYCKWLNATELAELSVTSAPTAVDVSLSERYECDAKQGQEDYIAYCLPKSTEAGCEEVSTWCTWAEKTAGMCKVTAGAEPFAAMCNVTTKRACVRSFSYCDWVNISDASEQIAPYDSSSSLGCDVRDGQEAYVAFCRPRMSRAGCKEVYTYCVWRPIPEGTCSVREVRRRGGKIVT